MHAMFDVHTVDMPRDMIMMLVPPRGREGDSAVLQPQHHDHLILGLMVRSALSARLLYADFNSTTLASDSRPKKSVEK